MAPREGATGLEGLVTESRREDVDYSVRSTRELVELMNREDASVPAAVGSVAGKLSTAIDAIVERLRGGGRLDLRRRGLLRSDRRARRRRVRSDLLDRTGPGGCARCRDRVDRSGQRGRRGRRDRRCGRGRGARASRDGDAVVGVSASGRTPYVLAALERARAAGAVTVAVVSAHGSELAAVVDHELAVVVGPEVIAGSTRLKAGTAQKLVLNTISTVAMIRLGKTYGDLMVDVRASNAKLASPGTQDRSRRDGRLRGRGGHGARSCGRQREGRGRRTARRRSPPTKRAPGWSARAATSDRRSRR